MLRLCAVELARRAQIGTFVTECDLSFEESDRYSSGTFPLVVETCSREIETFVDELFALRSSHVIGARVVWSTADHFRDETTTNAGELLSHKLKGLIRLFSGVVRRVIGVVQTLCCSLKRPVVVIAWRQNRRPASRFVFVVRVLGHV